MEQLHFKIGISGTYWDKVPNYKILINDTVICSKKIKTPSDKVSYVEFDHSFDDGDSTLKILLTNKDDSDVVKDNNNSDNFTIVKDMLLNIVSVEIDEIDLGHLIFTHSTFVGDDLNRPVLKNCLNLGWNGTWSLPFNIPFYIWLLERI